MTPKHSKESKGKLIAVEPFPWRCRHCGKTEVVMSTIPYTAEVRHDGRLHAFTIPALHLPICQACGEKVFTEQVDRQINDALRSHLRILPPAAIEKGIKRVELTQKEFARRVGVAEATLSRWLNETQIQSKALDNLLRLFLAFPEVRAALPGDAQDRSLGLGGDYVNSALNCNNRTPDCTSDSMRRINCFRRARGNGMPTFGSKTDSPNFTCEHT